jgi:hypothetical protein
MIKSFWLVLLIAFIVLSCKEKKKTDTEKNDFLPVKSFLQSQVKHVDTSMYPIVKAEKMNMDSTWDTSYVKREDFRKLADEFLNIPDLTDGSLGKNYKEDKLFDNDLDRVIVSYTPLKDNLELIKEEVVITQGTSGTDQIHSIIIEKIKEEKDSTIHQRLLWQTDEKFQVVTIVEKKGQPVSTKTTEVTWNQPDQ